MLEGHIPLSRLFPLISMGKLFSIYEFRCLRDTFRNVTPHISENPLFILCDISTGHPCPFIPVCLCNHVFDLIHGLSPLGTFHGRTPEVEVHMTQYQQRCQTLGMGMCPLSVKQSNQTRRVGSW